MSAFDATKRYKELECQNGQFVASEDFNHIQDMQNYDKRELQKFLQGFQLTIKAMVNAPVLKVKADYNLIEGQVITIEMVNATHAKWKKNGGAFSGSIAVTCDNVTWNTLGTSGLAVVFKNTAATADVSEVWVAQAIRLLGGAIVNTAPGTFQVAAGRWGILGEFEEFSTALTAVGCADTDYLYMKVERNNIAHTADPDIGHRLADGQYATVSPEAVERDYTLMSSAVFPANVSSPYAQYIIVGKIIDAAGGTSKQMWEEPQDLQRMFRLYNDTTAPVAPTGLALSTGSEVDFVEVTIQRSVQAIPLLGYLTMLCNENAEADIDYYEFKVTRLVSIGGALTADSWAQIVRTNNDAGGAMSVPLGVTHTYHGMQIGVPYRVWVRAIDLAGNVGTWSASVDTVIGGVGTIAAIDAGPTFSLLDPGGFVGFEVSVTALPALARGFTIWAQNDSYPTTTSSANAIGSYDSTVGTVRVPWNEGTKPYVRMKAYDSKGIYQILESESNLSLSVGSQLVVENHNAAASSHGGLIGDLGACQEPYGSVYRWLNQLSSSAWAPQDVYILGGAGTSYQTLAACFTAIAASESGSSSAATIFVMPGDYGTGADYTIPTLLRPVTIVGFDAHSCFLHDSFNFSNITTSAFGGFSPKLSFYNVSFSTAILGDSAVGARGVHFTRCHFLPSTGATQIMNVTTSATGSWHFKFDNCFFRGDPAVAHIELTGKVNFIFNQCEFIILSTDAAVVLLNTPTGTVRLFRGCSMQIPTESENYVITSSGADVPYTVWAFGCAWNIAPPAAKVTVEDGNVTTNTVIASLFLSG